MGKMLHFDKKFEKQVENIPSAVAYGYADFLDEESAFIRLIMPSLDNIARECCSCAALDFNKFSLVPEMFFNSLTTTYSENMLATGEPLYITYTWKSNSGMLYFLDIAVFSLDDDGNISYSQTLRKENKDGKRLFYDFESNVWKEDEAPADSLFEKYEKLSEKESPEADMIDAVLSTCPEYATKKAYRAIKSKCSSLFSLYNATNRFMLPFILPADNIHFGSNKPCAIFGDDEKYILCLIPDDVLRHGFMVAADGKQLILYQYLDSEDINLDSENEFYFDAGIYIREVGRTSDIAVVKQCLQTMANRYTKEDVYTLPISLYASTEAFNLKNIGKKAFKHNHKELTETEKKCLELTQKGIKQYLEKINF